MSHRGLRGLVDARLADTGETGSGYKETYHPLVWRWRGRGARTYRYILALAVGGGKGRGDDTEKSLEIILSASDVVCSSGTSQHTHSHRRQAASFF